MVKQKYHKRQNMGASRRSSPRSKQYYSHLTQERYLDYLQMKEHARKIHAEIKKQTAMYQENPGLIEGFMYVMKIQASDLPGGRNSLDEVFEE